MLLVWFALSIVALFTKTASNAIGEEPCDMFPSCTSDYLSYPIIPSKQPVLRCKKTQCDELDNNLIAVNQINNIDIYLKDIQVRKKKDDYQIQVILSSYDDLIKQGNQSLLVKFSLGLYEPCYEFLIPFSVIMDYKDILFPCLLLSETDFTFFFRVYKETDEFVSAQAIQYSLNNVAVGQSLGGSPFRITYDWDDDFIYFSLNATQNLGCLFHYNISIHNTSTSGNLCDVSQTPVHHWSDELNSPSHRLNMSRSSLQPGKNFCIYTILNKVQQCRTLHTEIINELDVFQVPHLIADKFHSNVQENFCKNWNFSYYRRNIKNDVIFTMTPWFQYSSCFSHYCLYLYEFNMPTCDTDEGTVRPRKFKSEARFNKTVIFNSPVCAHRQGHLLRPEKLNFENFGERANQIEIVFKNVSIGYYCIWVVPFSVDGSDKHNWSRHTHPISITETEENNNTKWNTNNKDASFYAKLIVSISLLLLLIAFIMWSCSNRMKTSFQHNESSQVVGKPSDAEARESIPISTVPVDKVFLFYSHDDKPIKNDVSRLKTFLKDGPKSNVRTLSDELPEIQENCNVAISNLLECGCSGEGATCSSNKKFIIVISGKVLRNNEDGDFDSISLEEKAFHFVLNSLRGADWRKAYCHLFLVAFNQSVFEDRRFEKIVPKSVIGVCYTIPNDLENLCLKLGFSSSIEELSACMRRY